MSILLLAAAAAVQPQPLPMATPAAAGPQQLFIAPSGEPFRAPPGAPYPLAAWFTQADANHDGKLTETEFDRDFMRFFDQLDRNHDGTIDEAEMARYTDAIVPEVRFGGVVAVMSESSRHFRGADGGQEEMSQPAESDDKPRYVAPMSGAARFDLLGLANAVAAMDLNLNGRVSRDEAVQSETLRFAALDQAQRGYLTLDQLPEPMAQRHPGKARRGR